MAAVVAFTAPAPAQAVEVVAGFDNLAAGTSVTTQVPGVTFTPAPRVFNPVNVNAFTQPHAARHPLACNDANCSNGAYKLELNFAKPARVVKLRVGDDEKACFEFCPQAKLYAFDQFGDFVGSSQQLPISSPGNRGPITTQLIAAAKGGAYSIRSAVLYVGREDVGNFTSPTRAQIDDLRFEVQQAAPKPPPTPGAIRTPPSASVRLATGTPRAGVPVVFDASRSRPSTGARIVAYEWDWNNDGRFDANTGKRPTANFVYGSGPQRVRLRITDSSGARDMTSLGVFIPRPPPAGCEALLRREGVEIAAWCIKREGERYEISTFGGSATINGIRLQSDDRDAKLVWDLEAGELRSSSEFAVLLPNMPAGDLLLHRGGGGTAGRRGRTPGADSRFSWSLPRPRTPGAPRRSSAANHGQSGDLPGFHVATFRVGGECKAFEVCQKLPGGFPVLGHVDVYIDKGEREAILDVQVGLVQPIYASADLRLRLSLDRGLHLDTLKFEIPETPLGFMTLRELKFAYTAPGAGSPPVEGERWEANLKVELPTSPTVRLAGGLRFTDGRLDYLTAELESSRGVPIAPGVELNRLAGGYGNPPLRIEGGLGAKLVEVADLEGDFTYTKDAGVGHAAVLARLNIVDHEIANANVHIWSNGFVSFGLNVHFKFPSRPVLVEVRGGLNGWFEDANGIRFQIEGEARVDVWVIGATAKVLVNNTWLAGCATIRVPVLPDPKARAAYNLKNGDLDLAWSCSLRRYRIEPTRHAPPTASAAQARTFTVPRGLRELGVRVRSGRGTPVVTLVAPNGERFATPARPGQIAGRTGRYFAAQHEPQKETIIHLLRPQAGRWRLEPAPGSPTDLRLDSALPLPNVRVKAAVRGRGHRRVLRYRIRRIRGQRVTFVERGRAVTKVIGTARGARGSFRFRPQDGPRGRRRIEAVVMQDGITRATVPVTRYIAPRPLRPTRPKKVKLRRRGGRVIVKWTRARHATRYRILVRASDGRRNYHFVSRKRRRLRLRIEPFERVRVSVRGEHGPMHRPGKARSARLKAKRLKRRG